MYNPGTGGFSAIPHLFFAYPKTMATVCIISAMLSNPQNCGDKTVVEQTSNTAVAQSVETVVAQPSIENAPVITDVFQANGKTFSWKHAGADPAHGRSIEWCLAQLGYTEAERNTFLKKIEVGDGEMDYLTKGEHIGRMTTGSGRLHENTIVGFKPVRVKSGKIRKNDGRVRIYRITNKVMLDGQEVMRTVILLEPFVCRNWSRPSDEIAPISK